jgi:hypothetical protein
MVDPIIAALVADVCALLFLAFVFIDNVIFELQIFNELLLT